MTRPTVRIVALLAALALAVSACGGGGSDESSSGSESLQGSSSGGSSSSGDSGSSGTADVEFGGDFDGSVSQCLEIAQAFGVIAMGPSMALLSGDQSIEDVRKQLGGETFTVPSELEGPFEVLDNAFAELEQSLDGINISDALGDPAAMERIEEASAVYDTDEVRNALEEVGTFLEDNCTDFNASDFGG
jgi:hypothetical protein